MRVLFSCLPGFGHFHPMVPLARALEGAGHEVAFATADRFCRRVIEPAGFATFAAGLSPLVVEDRTRELPEVAALADDDTWRLGAYMFAHVSPPEKVADLVGVIEAWQPQVVIHDTIDFAAPLAAAASGLPWAGLSFGALQPSVFWDLSGQLLDPLWRVHGLAPEPAGGVFRYLYLDICPPSFQTLDDGPIAVRYGMRPVAFDTTGGAALPPWFTSLPELPVVYVTMGTIFNDTPGVFEAVLRGLGGQPINVIITVGLDRDPAELGPLPSNVHAERWIPQSLVFDACDAVVCHAGSGTTLQALSFGLPMLVLPHGANQFWNAERCVSLGVGRMLRPDEIDGARVRAEVDRLLLGPSFRLAAAEIQREIEQMPPPASAVHLVETLAHDRQPISSRFS